MSTGKDRIDMKSNKMLRAEAREDKDCFERYHYHTWYADCPNCKKEVSQNDRYWR